MVEWRNGGTAELVERLILAEWRDGRNRYLPTSFMVHADDDTDTFKSFIIPIICHSFSVRRFMYSFFAIVLRSISDRQKFSPPPVFHFLASLFPLLILLQF
jgi:hypothetical protein